MEASDKKTLYTLIRSLGGEATSTLNTSTNTHLVCVDCSGAKYEEAVRSGIMIVGPEWVKACQVRNERVDEKEFEVDRDIDDDEHQVEDQVEETVNQNCDKGGEKGGNEHSCTCERCELTPVPASERLDERTAGRANTSCAHSPNLPPVLTRQTSLL